jgi:hypothetical protein
VQRTLTVALFVFVVNLPFGFWRSGTRKLSLPWFVAVHAPVPLVVLMRWASGLGFQLATFPALVGAFFAGQLVGGRLRGTRRPGDESRASRRESKPPGTE